MTEAARRKTVMGLINEEIGRLVGKELDTAAVDESRVSRCLTGDTATFELVEAISVVLKMPPPVFVANSIAEALAMAGVRATSGGGKTEQEKAPADDAKISSAKRRIAKVRSEAKSVAARHRDPVGSPHGVASRRDDGSAEARRRGAGRS